MEQTDGPTIDIDAEAIEHPPVPVGPATPERLLAIAVQSGAGIEQLEKLMDLHERWEAGQARKAFYAAMGEFQATVPTLAKNKTVSFGNTEYKHATLAGIAKAIRVQIQATGLSYRFETAPADDGLTVTCIVTHVDGHSERTAMSAPPDKSGAKNSIQSLGSTMTYMRRYTLVGALGLTTDTEDDDGRGAPDPPSPLDDAQLPEATEQTDEAASIRGPYGLWIREIRDERDAGKEGTRRELLIRDWPDHWRLITYSNFEKYKGDGKNEWKNPGVNRPCTTNIPKGRNVGKQVHFLGEHLRHPAATGAIDVPGFEWEDAPREFKPDEAGEAGGDVSDVDALRVEAVRLHKAVEAAHNLSRALTLQAAHIGEDDTGAAASFYKASVEELVSHNAAATALLAERKTQ